MKELDEILGITSSEDEAAAPDSDESFQASEGEEEKEDELTEENESTEEEDETDVDFSDNSNSSVDELIASAIKRKKKSSRISYDSDESDYQPSNRRRRAATKQVSYKESSDETEVDEILLIDGQQVETEQAVYSPADPVDQMNEQPPPGSPQTHHQPSHQGLDSSPMQAAGEPAERGLPDNDVDKMKEDDMNRNEETSSKD